MTNRNFWVVILGVVLAICLTIPAVGPVVAQSGSNSGQVIGSPQISVFATSQEFEPGTQDELELTLTNRGSISRGGPAQYEERVTTARGVVVEVESESAPIEINTGAVGVGNVPTGTSQVPPLDITIREDAEPGTYRVPVSISYDSTRSVDYDSFGPEYSDFNRDVTRYVTIQVRNQSRFEVVSTNTTAQIGDRGTLSVEIENVGSRAARGASVTATSRSDELSFGTGSESSTANVGTWEPGERRTVEYTVEMTDDATLREYTLDINTNYRDTDGIDRSSRTLNVGVRPLAEQSFSLANVTTDLRVGEEGTISGTIINQGPAPASNPVVVLSTTNENIVIDSPEYPTSDIAPGERADFEYTVTASEAASASPQQFNFTTRYRNSRGNIRTSDSLETTERIKPQRDRFTVESSIEGIEAGSSQTVTIQITNNGNDSLRNVEAKAFVSDPLSSDNDDAIVDGLAPGETAEFNISLSAAGGALAKNYPVSIDFQYQMPDGDTELSSTYVVVAPVTASEEGGFPTELAIGVLILVGILGIVGWRRRRS